MIKTREIEDIKKEYLELLSNWNGESLQTEELIQELAGELEDLGVNLDEVES